MILKADCFPALRGYILSLDLPCEDSVRHGEFEFTTSVGGERTRHQMDMSRLSGGVWGDQCDPERHTAFDCFRMNFVDRR